jgi:DNA polymerase-3 subunit alpha
MTSYDLSFAKDAGSIKLVGVIHSINVKTSKTGKKYAFIQLSDSCGNFEVMVFTQMLEKHRSILEVNKVIVIDAQIKVETKEDSEEEIIKLITQSLEPFEGFLIDQNNYIQIHIKDLESLPKVTQLLKSDQGVKVYLKFIITAAQKLIHISPSSGVELSSKCLIHLEKIPGIEVKWL